jgi:hypothetical protein
MRWYWVWCLDASDLKNATLLLLKASFTFTPSSRNASSLGDGRKSAEHLDFTHGLIRVNDLLFHKVPYLCAHIQRR